MKKTLYSVLALTCLLLLTITPTVQAQNGRAFYKTSYKNRNSGSFSSKASLLSFGIGFPNRSGAGYDWDSDRLGFGPLYVKYEHGILNELGIGGYVAGAASRHKYGPNDRYTDKIFSVSVGAMAYYHFNKLIPVRKLDVYAGAGIGGRQLSYTYDNDWGGSRYHDSNFDIIPLFKVGARYYFTKMFGVYGEGGYDDMSDVNLGITLRF
ncbi:porin family protein [Taibaiella chishuiensis]|uniref:Outer membrane protein with beta-barrel domain n=1 Tax=Taibaiella chishuiensis TaxID=1434707 RepID=A0A2P8DCQ4_9BACT|nr:porin family protein [Taibaiella chishuiensis]PSK94992.1 hypothetical protein B0I18_1011156 [Taibaiella chishuiensis]